MDFNQNEAALNTLIKATALLEEVYRTLEDDAPTGNETLLETLRLANYHTSKAIREFDDRASQSGPHVEG